MRIRRAKLSDVDRIYHIGKDEFKKAGWGYWFTKKTLRNLISQQPELCWVLEIEDRVEGARFVFDEWNKNLWGWVILVSEPLRGRGYGTLLFEKTRKILKRRHYRKLFSDVAVEDLPSIRWHRKRGYERVGTFKDWFGKGKDAIIFSIDL